jgi:hypothetical protein
MKRQEGKGFNLNYLLKVQKGAQMRKYIFIIPPLSKIHETASQARTKTEPEHSH